jgi:hypothetical protein
VFPLLVRRQSGSFSGSLPDRAVAPIKDPALKALVAAFIKQAAVAASKSTP